MVTPTRIRRTTLGATAAAAFTGLCALPGIAVANAATADDTAAPSSSTPSSCVSGLDDLSADSVARASDTALAELPAAFPDRDVTGAYIVGATRSEAGPVGRQVAENCGGTVQSKSVIVDFVFPAMLPDAAKTYGAAVVSDFGDAYHIWRTT